MAERCPLGPGLYWDSRNDIPQFCRANCEKLWEMASEAVGQIDMFNPDCQHDIEYNDRSLQRLTGSGRLYAVLYDCMDGCDEVFAEEWVFTCPEQ